MTYSDLNKINSTLKTVDIKGKKYVQVNERVKAFRQLFPMGKIETSIISNDTDVVVMEAIASDENGNVLATGHAFEEKASSYINKTSYIENCETSAVGRCLGMLGIGIDDSIGSADEVRRAIAQQETKPVALITKLNDNASAELIDRVVILTDELGVDIEKLLLAYKETDINKISIEKLDEAIDRKRSSVKRG